MCGISAIVFTEHAKKDWTILDKMARHQRMRGPDGLKTWTHNNTGLAHNRLAIVDTSPAGDMPMGSLHWEVVFNGEIYNYKKLREHLHPNDDMAGAKLAGNDSRLLVDYLEKYGFENTLQDIEGMFAFVAWNYGERKLYCAVDHLSIKQLFCFTSDKMFAVASSPGALTNCKEKWEFNSDALTDYLALGATKNPLFAGMYKIPPGGYGVYDQATESVTIGYWHGEYSHHDVKEQDILKETLESIQSVKEADVPVCMFLSGGIDSTVVGSQCPGMPAVHLASPEEEYAQQVGKKYGNAVNVIRPEHYDARLCLQDYAIQSGDCSMAAIIPYIVSKEIAKTHKVAISSNGADELFFGYNRIKNSVNYDQLDHIFRHSFLNSDGCSWKHGKDARELELSTYVAYDLNKTLDFASMCHGLEVRVPYLNRKVVEKALSLPRERHVFGYRTKRILKEFLLKEGFSDQFVDRAKQGFSLFYEPEGHEMLKNEGVKFLKERFGIDPGFKPGTRDERYYAASAASFLCWWQVWQTILV